MAIRNNPVSSVAPLVELLSGAVRPALEGVPNPLKNSAMPDTLSRVLGIAGRPVDMDQVTVALAPGGARGLLAGQGGIGAIPRTKSTATVYDEAVDSFLNGKVVRPAIFGDKQGRNLKLFIPTTEFGIPETVVERGGFSWLNPAESQQLVSNLQDFSKTKVAESIGFNPMNLIQQYRDDGSVRVDLGNVSNLVRDALQNERETIGYVDNAGGLWDFYRRSNLAAKLDDATSSQYNRPRGSKYLGGVSLDMDQSGQLVLPVYDKNGVRSWKPITDDAKNKTIFVMGRDPRSQSQSIVQVGGENVPLASISSGRPSSSANPSDPTERIAIGNQVVTTVPGGTVTSYERNIERVPVTPTGEVLNLDVAVRAKPNPSTGQVPRPQSVSQTVARLGDKQNNLNENYDQQVVGKQIPLVVDALTKEPLPAEVSSALSKQRFEIGAGNVEPAAAMDIIGAARRGLADGLTWNIRRQAPALDVAKQVVAGNFGELPEGELAKRYQAYLQRNQFANAKPVSIESFVANRRLDPNNLPGDINDQYQAYLSDWQQRQSQRVLSQEAFAQQAAQELPNIPVLAWNNGDTISRIGFATRKNADTGYDELVALQNMNGQVAEAPARFGFTNRADGSVAPTVTVGNQVLELGNDQLTQLRADLGLGTGIDAGVEAGNDFFSELLGIATQPLPNLNDPNLPKQINVRGLYKYGNDDAFNWVEKNYGNNFARALNYGDISIPAPQLSSGGLYKLAGSSSRPDVADAFGQARLTDNQSIVLNPTLFEGAQFATDIDERLLLQNLSNTNVLAGESISVPRTVVIPNEGSPQAVQAALNKVGAVIGRNDFNALTDEAGNPIAYYFGEQPSVVRELPNFEERTMDFIRDPGRFRDLIVNRVTNRLGRSGERTAPGNLLVSPEEFARKIAYEDKYSPLTVDLVGGGKSYTHTDQGVELGSSFLSERERTQRDLLMGAGLRRTLFPDEFYGPNATVSPEVNALIDNVVYGDGSFNTDQQAVLEQFMNEQQLGFDMVGEATEDSGRRFTDFILQRYANAAQQGVTPEDIIQEVKKGLSQPTDTPELLQTAKYLDQINREIAGRENVDPIDVLLGRALIGGIDKDTDEARIVRQALRRRGYDDLARRAIEMGNLPVTRSYSIDQGGGGQVKLPPESMARLIEAIPTTGEAQDWSQWQSAPPREEGRVIAMRANASTPEQLSQPRGQWVSIPQERPLTAADRARQARFNARQIAADNYGTTYINTGTDVVPAAGTEELPASDVLTADSILQFLAENDKANFWRGRAMRNPQLETPVEEGTPLRLSGGKEVVAVNSPLPVVDTYINPDYVTDPLAQNYLKQLEGKVIVPDRDGIGVNAATMRPGQQPVEVDYINVRGVPTDFESPLTPEEIAYLEEMDRLAMIERGDAPGAIQIINGEVVDTTPRQPTAFMSEDDRRYLYEMGYGDNRYQNTGGQTAAQLGMQPDTVLPPTTSDYDSSNQVRVIQDTAPTKEDALAQLRAMGVAYDPANLENGFIQPVDNSLRPAVQQLQSQVSVNRYAPTVPQENPETAINTYIPAYRGTGNPEATNATTTAPTDTVTVTTAPTNEGGVSAVRNGGSNESQYNGLFTNPWAWGGALAGVGAGLVTLDMIRNARSFEEQQYLMNQYLMQQQMMSQYQQPQYTQPVNQPVYAVR